MLRVLRALIAVVFVISGSAFASGLNTGSIQIEEPWSRATVKGIPNGVAYFAIHNKGSEIDKLIAASSDVAEKTEIHTHIQDGDVMRMRQVDFVEIPSEETVEFKPGGLHIMFMGLKQPLQSGQTIKLNLTFEKAGNVTIDVDVHKINKKHHSGDHNHHHH